MKSLLLSIIAATLALSAPGASAQSITDVPGRHERPERQVSPSAELHHSQRGEATLSNQRQERAGRYRIQDGRMKIDFRCPDGEPDRDCADLLLQVLDRLQGGAFSEDSGFRSYEDRDRSRDR